MALLPRLKSLAKQWLKLGLRRAWRILLWRPFGRSVHPPLAPGKSKVWAVTRRALWGVTIRVAILPLLAAALWAVTLFCLTHPERQAIQTFPDQFSLLYEDVNFTSDDGVKLSGWYITSLRSSDVLEGDRWRRLRPGVVVCHGYGGRRDQMLYPLVNILHQMRYDVLLFDFRGHGRSGSAPVSFGLTEAADVIAAVDFLRERAGVDPNRIALIGTGMGGYASILAAPRCKGVRCVVAEGLYPSIETMLRRKMAGAHAPAMTGSSLAWGLSLYYGYRIMDDTAIEAVHSFGGKGLLLISGTSDQQMPAADLEPVLSAARSRASSLVVARAGHSQALADSGTVHLLTQYLGTYLSSADADVAASDAPPAGLTSR